jgi:predicted nucleic acid-binding protein
MTVAYFDSSALVKLLLDEDGQHVSRAVWDAADATATSRLAYPEVRAGLAAAFRGRRLDPDRYLAAKVEWGRRWSELRLIEPGPGVLEAAGELAESCALRGFDAVHLASALRLGVDGDGPILVAWDERLRAAATEFGLRTAPAGGSGGREA